jgi:hypothetical protein
VHSYQFVQLSTQSPTEKEIGSLSSGGKWPELETTAYLHLAQRVRIAGAIPPLSKKYFYGEVIN